MRKACITTIHPVNMAEMINPNWMAEMASRGRIRVAVAVTHRSGSCWSTTIRWC